MKNLSTFLAWRYLTFKSQDKNISFMIKICFWGIFIGTFALMLTLIITNGFEKTIHEKMQGINSQIVMESPGNKIDYKSISNCLEKEFYTDIAAISGNVVKQAIIEQNNSQTVVFLKGIDPETEPRVTTVAQKLIRPLPKETPKFGKLIENNKIIIGAKMAKDLHLLIGDQITMLIPEPSSRKSISLKKQKFEVGGIFKVGLEEYDNNFAFTNIDFLNNLYDEKGVDQISIRLVNPESVFSFSNIRKHSTSNGRALLIWLKIKAMVTMGLFNYEKEVITLLRKRLPHLTINTWKDLYPALVSSLKLEKYVMFFILALITLVASMNMISLLFMQIQQKIHDIAIFKAMGLDSNTIKSIFLHIGLTISFFASALGLGCAAIAGYLLNKYPFIKLPDVYFVSHLPARMDFEIFAVVFGATILLGFIATWIPAQRAKNIKIAQSLRQE